MSLLQKIVAELGNPYIIRNIDQESLIYRKLDTGYEFEVSGIKSISGKCILYVWSVNPRFLIGEYDNVPVAELKDILGHYAFKYRNLHEKILVERED